ncbi:MAG: LuxR C-terminal-related transcriptional regulator [Gemmatimonadota bacterium]
MLHSSPTIFVVDPDPAVRASLEVVIRRTGWTPETFPTMADFLARPRRLAPSCLLLEIMSPLRDGFDLQQRIATERRETPIIVISGQSDVSITVRAMKAGAVEFLLKPLVNSLFLTACADAIARSACILQQEAERLELQRRYDSLSHREREVMALVVTGRLNKQVGGALAISEITVKAHRGKVMRKMAADSLAELVIMAIRLRLPPEPANMIRPTTARLAGAINRTATEFSFAGVSHDSLAVSQPFARTNTFVQ